jgi:hypothetical protein
MPFSTKALCVLFAVTLISIIPTSASAKVVSGVEVLEMMERVPSECSLMRRPPHWCPRGPAGFERGRDARLIASAISSVAKSREEAALLAVFSSYESGNFARAVGDGGRSLGAWQIQGIGAGAFDPYFAASYWLDLANRNIKGCWRNAPDERLASLASGSCFKARAKVRLRVRLARELAKTASAKEVAGR